MAEGPGFFRRVWDEPSKLILIILISLIIFQIVSYLIGLVYGPASEIRLGWAILLIALALSIFLAFSIVYRRFSLGYAYTRGDIFVLLLIVGGMAFLLMKLPDLVPQVFSVATGQLQSIFGLP